MHRRILGVLTAATLALPVASHAEELSYTYAEIAYLDTEVEVDDFDVDGDGFGLRGSIAVYENFFVFAQYEDLGFDFGVDATSWQLGAGGHWPLTPALDVVGRVGIVKAELEVGRFDTDDDGFLLGARLRGVIAPRFELEGGFDYTDLDDVGNDTTLVGEGRYSFTNQFSAGVLLNIGDDATTIGLAARVNF